MALPMLPDDIPVPHPPNGDRSVGSARGFPPPRPWIRSIGYLPKGAQVPTEHVYVQRYWAALIGTAALEDLLRLAAAARRQTPLRRPTHLHVLIAESLASPLGPSVVAVLIRLPLLDEARIKRLPFPLRAAAQRAIPD